MKDLRLPLLSVFWILVLLLALTAVLCVAPVNGGLSETATSTPSLTATPTPTRCPSATPEPLWVEPVVSPTELLTQTVTVRIGNGEAVTVTAESGVFTVTGHFNAYGNPALVRVNLLPNTVHHVWVLARVRRIEQWGCIYGGYTLSTTRDRHGQSLVIEQRMPVRPLYLPLLLQLQWTLSPR